MSLVVVRMNLNHCSYASGIREGDVVVAVNGEEVQSLAHYAEMAHSERSFWLTLRRPLRGAAAAAGARRRRRTSVRGGTRGGGGRGGGGGDDEPEFELGTRVRLRGLVGAAQDANGLVGVVGAWHQDQNRFVCLCPRACVR
jgi:hypothetical protein